jgi:hypothetical protein
MKKLILAMAALVACAQAAFSQGVVSFANTGTFATTADRAIYIGQVGGVKLTGTNYVAALYWGRTADALNDYAVRAIGTDETLDRAVGAFRAVDPTSGAAGTWSGGTRFFIGAVTGNQLFLQVRVWDLAKGQTYDSSAAAGGLVGVSDPFPYLVASPTDAPGQKIDNFRAFAVNVVPEPSTIALAVLGLGSLLLFRRKKA